jgi:hypothetical protein
MNIRERENQIFSKWQEQIPNMVQDGVVDPSAYLESHPKILFILKEVNDANSNPLKNGGWDLRNFVFRGCDKKWQTWNSITRWVHGIRRLPTPTIWKEVAKISQTKRKEELRSVAAMNLKKSPGGASTKYGELEIEALKYKSLLAEQFWLYDADLVICCGRGVAKLAWKVFQPDDQRDWEQTSRGVWYKKYKSEKFIISYKHPQVPSRQSLLFDGILEAIAEIDKSV